MHFPFVPCCLSPSAPIRRPPSPPSPPPPGQHQQPQRPPRCQKPFSTQKSVNRWRSYYHSSITSEGRWSKQRQTKINPSRTLGCKQPGFLETQKHTTPSENNLRCHHPYSRPARHQWSNSNQIIAECQSTKLVAKQLTCARQQPAARQRCKLPSTASKASPAVATADCHQQSSSCASCHHRAQRGISW